MGRGPSPDRVKTGALTHGKLMPLNQPRSINVEAGANGTPLTVERRAVEAVLETWRIDDEWWQPRPVSRIYWRVLLEDGRTIDVYHDRVRECWFKQAYSG